MTVDIEQIKREALEAQGLSLVEVMSTGDTIKKYAIIYAIDYLHSRGYLGGVWQPIETAPKGKHEIFYVSSKKYYPPYVVVNAAKDCPLKDEYPWRTHQSGNMIHKSIITHWQPLPAAPRSELLCSQSKELCSPKGEPK